MKKVFYIILAIIIITLTLVFVFYEHIVYFIYLKRYDIIETVEKTLTYNRETSLIQENSLTKNNIKVILSDLNYTQNLLNVDFKFSHLDNIKGINSVGYVLRVYNEDYFLGNRYIGKISLSDYQSSVFDNIFYKRTFNDDMSKNLSNDIKFLQQVEILESEKSLLHRLTFTFKNEFAIKDNLNIILFDITYQDIGDKNFYKIDKSLSEIEYTINNI